MPKGQIGRLDFTPRSTVTSSNGDTERTRLVPDSTLIDSPGPESSRREGYFFENVAQGIQDRDRARLKRELVRTTSFVWAILSW